MIKFQTGRQLQLAHQSATLFSSEFNLLTTWFLLLRHIMWNSWQVIALDGATVYERGCIGAQGSLEYENGCFGGSNTATICYKTCTGDKCNDHRNLDSSASSTTVGLLAALIYSLFKAQINYSYSFYASREGYTVKLEYIITLHNCCYIIYVHRFSHVGLTTKMFDK